ncbi:hypothetical protein ASPZODRAFT_114132 [Penicilliopsis zonata CBS 506.65]|uniref:RING-type domain-containing protein n=1 Tax=Penicilliopsis zonata CBS 506.65 TaxID=1073090 RepID=A0A1L9SJV9_9EURO|nr:hypothetical protein ASPZODRAFT_114132 [Penicilliopsis zonata CBS 506.65]OJJ47445.1 hypothetical protein ASPZODRAFT_114132 [Penicilliopsis zonata CBS 506.65]
MTFVKTEVLFAGPVPGLLATRSSALETEPPIKRRKLSNGNHKAFDGLEPVVPSGYIPLARFELEMNHSQSNQDPEQQTTSATIDLPHRIPVSLKTARFVQDARDSFRLELEALPDKELVFADTILDPRIATIGDHLKLANELVSVDRKTKTSPVVCYQSSLHCSSDRKSFRLETTILWKDSLEAPGTGYELLAEYVLSKYISKGQPDIPSEFVYARGKLSKQNQSYGWSPREFYDNVHVPEDTPTLSAEIKCDQVECQLYPFQRRAVRWLLQREGVELQADGQVHPVEKKTNDLPAYFVQAIDADGKVCFASHLFMIVTTDLSRWNDAADYLKGGILAEEMGLGKTVEMISLICLNRRRVHLERHTQLGVVRDGSKLSNATLIITPPAILEQWKQEIQTHAPSLQVFDYTGLQRHPELSDDELVDVLAGHDVVLTTYNVLAKEVHYTDDKPKRNLRHEKRFIPRKTPLVKISWWRVCLDEAQMIESGVSNAARVARLIPRQNAWAVTGTPLRKDIGDLFGLLLFLHYVPFCDSTRIWNRLYGSFKTILAGILRQIALRHSKDRIRSELHLPAQKRVVITVPFTAVEEQHYGQLYEQMCEECGLDTTGGPLREDWNPNSQAVIEKMRSWLTRLRQTCLHPEVAGSNRRALGTGSGPLRSVAEVLEVMIDQNDSSIRTEERALLLSQLRRGQLLENAVRRHEALDLWVSALERASEIVHECRNQLEAERAKALAATKADAATVEITSDNENEEIDKNSRLGTFRQRLRAALEVQHICKFFIGNAYYQIKTDPKLTVPDSDEFKDLEKREADAYEAAKLIRKEMLADIARRAGHSMEVIIEKLRKKKFVHIPKMKPYLYTTGLESRRLLDKFEDFCEALNKHAEQYNEWREKMIGMLSQSLIDQEEEAELEGNEYETSTKHQDEMYVYMEALRAIFADRNDALTGQQNILIAHEVKGGILQAQQGEGPSPSLFLSVMATRSKLKPDPTLGSLRGIISELRSLATSLEWQDSGGSSRARAELEIVNNVLQNASSISTEQLKTISQLEREVEMFRDTMNHRLEYYRQLQQISDTVAPYDDENVGKPLDEGLFARKLEQETGIDSKISALKAKRRYLVHLRDESGTDDTSKICVICQSSFEIGVLTVCGHKYCKDCLRIWWRQHRTCPICKKRLKTNEFHQITYKPQGIIVQEEKEATGPEPGRPSSSKASIFTDISSGIFQEIKDIDLNDSFGTKIDTLARHILWLRQHDPSAKSIVFSQYKNFLGVLGSAFSRFKIGYTSVDTRGGIERFKSDPAIECFLLHAKAHSSGLNLVNATHVFLCEPLINTAIELQAIARVHRIGQHRPTTVWMYLVSDTVEESIYEISVSRRLAHIAEKAKGRESTRESTARDTVRSVYENLTETAIDSANSSEMQDARLAKLMVGGASGGELVRQDDLWQCLFGAAARKDTSGQDMSLEFEVSRFLRGEAAEERRAAANGP